MAQNMTSMQYSFINAIKPPRKKHERKAHYAHKEQLQEET